MSRKSDLDKCLEALRGSGKAGSGNRCEAAIKAEEKQRRPSHVLGDPLAYKHLYKSKEAELRKFYDDLHRIADTSEKDLENKVREGWKILRDLKDPIAQLALNLTNRDETNSSRVADVSLMAQLRAKYFEENPPQKGEFYWTNLDPGMHPTKRPVPAWFLAQEQWANRKFREVQKHILLAHLETAFLDDENKYGKLDSIQIDRYHGKVFKALDLQPETFTGTIGTDPATWYNKLYADWIWCRECDERVSR